ncbi:MAG: hypothetical protein FWC26_08720 [Fibromonadales bacterium]|nr:hypothetical protein [Fibromonadales bacterium]
MNKTILMAGLALAMAFILSCSSDDSEGGGSGSGGIGDVSGGFQIWTYDGNDNLVKYKGGGVIRLELYNDNGEKYNNVGEVKGGTGKINLPASIPDEYLHDIWKVLSTNISASQPDVKIADAQFYVISGSRAYCLSAENENGDEMGYEYFSKAAHVGGNSSELGFSMNFDINASKGWNAIYISYSIQTGSFNFSTSSKSVNKSGMKWVIDDCGPATYYGGNETSGTPSSSSGGNTNPSSSSGGGSTTGSWCVDHDYEMCTNEPYYIASASRCAEWEGVLANSCPAGYDKEDYNNNEYVNCVYMSICTQMPANYCYAYSGEVVDTCPETSQDSVNCEWLGGCSEDITTDTCNMLGGTVVETCSETSTDNVSCNIYGSCIETITNLCNLAGGTVVESCPEE